MIVSVHVREATSEADANAKCKKLGAYFQILREYPSSKWHRRHVKTAPHFTGTASSTPVPHVPGKVCAWTVEFEVTRLPEPQAPGKEPGAANCDRSTPT